MGSDEAEPNPFSVGKAIGLRYHAADGRGTKDALSPGSASRAAFERLESGLWHDSRGDEGADVAQRLDTEAESLVEWARAEGWLIDEESWVEQIPGWRELDGASEHDVYEVPEHSCVIKATIPPNFGAQGTVEKYARNQLAANALFYDDIRLEGVLDYQGAVAIIISQPFIRGKSPTLDEIAEWFYAQGYEQAGYATFNRWRHPVTGADIADAHEGNFIKTEEGFLVPIDLQILKAPESSSA